MARRILSRITPSSVIATIALFAALGGGYAVAFSGSGTLQKAKVSGGFGSNFTTVRTLTGVGSIQASCSASEVTLRFHNGTGAGMVSSVDTGAEDPNVKSSVGAGENHDVEPEASGDDLFQWRLYPTALDQKRPQVDASIGVLEGTCGTVAEVAVLALNTED